MPNNELFYKNIQEAFGVEIEIGQKMADAILLWHKMYADEAPWLNNKLDIRSCGIPAAICSYFGVATAMEAQVEVTGSSRAEFLNDELRPIKDDLMNIVEYACAGGGIVLKPYISGGHIPVDYVYADSFFPVTFNSAKQITAAVFPEYKQIGRWLYTRLEYQEYDAAHSRYIIRNRAFKSKKAAVKIDDVINLGTEISLTEVDDWADMEPEVVLNRAKCPLFAYFRIPVANNVDRYSPLGVSIYSRAVNPIRDTDIQYGSILWEYKAKEAAVQASVEFFERKRDGSVVLPKGKERLYRNTGDVKSDNGTPFFNVYSPEIRDQSFFNGYNRMLQRVEFASHLAYGTLSDPQVVDKTAEEIKAGKQRTYATVKAIQRSLKAALNDLVTAMDAWATIGGLAPEGNRELSTDFDDSVIVDKESERATDRQDVAMGAMQLWEYRMKYRGETEEQAKAAVGIPEDVIE